MLCVYTYTSRSQPQVSSIKIGENWRGPIWSYRWLNLTERKFFWSIILYSSGRSIQWTLPKDTSFFRKPHSLPRFLLLSVPSCFPSTQITHLFPGGWVISITCFRQRKCRKAPNNIETPETTNRCFPLYTRYMYKVHFDIVHKTYSKILRFGPYASIPVDRIKVTKSRA